MQVAPRYQLKSRAARASYLRNFAFGVEDGLVSTVGLLAGVAATDVTRREVLITGVILVIVEGFSMATGSFLSESEGETYERGTRGSARRPLIDGAIMFGSYLLAGLIPLAPYVFFEIDVALYISIILSLVSLAGLGAVSARISKVGLLRNALRMLAIGGVAVAVGVLVGRLLQVAL
jgi:VIT1/CCC1 family predicted Fe2+/Mn2+ transporter